MMYRKVPLTICLSHYLIQKSQYTLHIIAVAHSPIKPLNLMSAFSFFKFRFSSTLALDEAVGNI